MWGNDSFVAVGEGIVLRSSDALNWTLTAASDPFALTRLRDFNGYLFAVGRMVQQGLRMPCYARIARDGAYMNLEQLPTRLLPHGIAWGGCNPGRCRRRTRFDTDRHQPADQDDPSEDAGSWAGSGVVQWSVPDGGHADADQR